MTAIYYEIRIAGLVPPGALRGFEQLAETRQTETRVRGPLPDQAAVNGLLTRLESCGLLLIGLRRHERRPAARYLPASHSLASHPLAEGP